MRVIAEVQTSLLKSKVFGNGMALQGGVRRRLTLYSICNFLRILRISIHGRSHLLSSLYAASRAQVTFGSNPVHL